MSESSSQKKMVVLTGAGISAESGLRTFRDGDGLWEEYDVYEVAHIDAWKKNPQLVLRFYNERRQQVLNAKPNKAHRLLAAMERDFDITIITQNIDDLHERAGSSKVLHLHGEILRVRSEQNAALKATAKGDIQWGQLAPDGAQLRPDIVWFGEEVPMMIPAAQITGEADIFVIIGTSLQVYPAAGLVQHVPTGVPIYVIDKNIPSLTGNSLIHSIEQPATIGVEELWLALGK
ncbi:MAG: SIR2 family NAD-dependent protein deacylase [Sediminibacterium sp.]